MAHFKIFIDGAIGNDNLQILNCKGVRVTPHLAFNIYIYIYGIYIRYIYIYSSALQAI